MKKRIGLVLLCAAIVVIILAGCSGAAKVETFAKESNQWSEPLIVSSQDAKSVKVTVDDNQLKFDLRAKESYVYEILASDTYADVTVETQMVNTGMLVNGMSILCRVNQSKTKWYEFRLSSSGEFQLFLFDQKLKDDGKNPYVELVKRGINTAVKPDKPNLVKATCKGTTLTLEANGTKIFEKENGDISEAGYVGLGAVAYNVIPVQIGFGQFSVQAQ